jgi:mannose-6-phosphate isomerase-like protein (cupin superfamily)
MINCQFVILSAYKFRKYEYLAIFSILDTMKHDDTRLCSQWQVGLLTASIIAAIAATLLLHEQAWAQMPKDLPPEVTAELAKSPKPPLPNQTVGIDIDRFVGDPLLSSVRVSRGVIYQRSILREGNPYQPGDPGAVLEYRKDYSLGTITGFNRTALVQIPEAQFWYVESGKGRLDNGDAYWDLHEGIGVLMAPNARHRVVNTTDEPLKMLMLTWVPVDPARLAQILVRDVYSLSLPALGAHWNYFGTNFFSPADGLHPNEAFAVVYMPPMTVAEPHAHIVHWEEIWTKLPPYGSYFVLGSEVRKMPPNTAFLAPPNSLTTHSVMNLMEHEYQAWLYIGRFVWPQPTRTQEVSVKPKPLKDSD